jgi:hypothetical protein
MVFEEKKKKGKDDVRSSVLGRGKINWSCLCS